jgi:hypothetical protein
MQDWAAIAAIAALEPGAGVQHLMQERPESLNPRLSGLRVAGRHERPKCGLLRHERRQVLHNGRVRDTGVPNRAQRDAPQSIGCCSELSENAIHSSLVDRSQCEKARQDLSQQSGLGVAQVAQGCDRIPGVPGIHVQVRPNQGGSHLPGLAGLRLTEHLTGHVGRVLAAGLLGKFAIVVGPLCRTYASRAPPAPVRRRGPLPCPSRW